MNFVVCVMFPTYDLRTPNMQLPRNHPIIKEDGVLASFLSEPSFEAWRKQNAVSLDEESASKRVDRTEEMTIPSDLEEKIV